MTARAAVPAVAGGRPVRDVVLPIFRLTVSEGEMAAVRAVLESGQISRGPLRDQFARQACDLMGCPHAVVVSSGTAALHLAVAALGLESGSEIIVPSLSFVATAFAAEYAGLRPVFADVQEATGCIDPEDVERRITPRTRGIIPVHFAGEPAPLDAIYEIAGAHRLAVVEDAAHAIGASYRGRPIGAFPVDSKRRNVRAAVAFSLFATKNVTAGEGGIVTTDDAALAQTIERLRAHGIVPRATGPQTSGFYDVVDLGYNYHLSNLNIALGMEQLKRVDELTAQRRDRAKRLTELLHEVEEIECPRHTPDHVFHLYNVHLHLDRLRVGRDAFVAALLAEGIQVGVYYLPTHLFSYYRERYGTGPGDLPVTEALSERTVTLPLYPSLTDEELIDISEAVRKVAGHFSR